jgi:hypothetical protein
VAQVFLLGIFAAAIGFFTGAVKVWKWSRGRSSAYRLVSIALLVVGLWFLLGAVGILLQPL